MASSTSTINAASAALSSLLARRQKQKMRSRSASPSPIDGIKKRKSVAKKTKLRHEVRGKARSTSTVAMTEEEEMRLKQLAAKEKLKNNVDIIMEFAKEGKKERAAREELLKLRKEKDMARKGKGKKPEIIEDSDSDSD